MELTRYHRYCKFSPFNVVTSYFNPVHTPTPYFRYFNIVLVLISPCTKRLSSTRVSVLCALQVSLFRAACSASQTHLHHCNYLDNTTRLISIRPFLDSCQKMVFRVRYQLTEEVYQHIHLLKPRSNVDCGLYKFLIDYTT
jgi:hypothetical protein